MIELLNHQPEETRFIKDRAECAWHACRVDATGELYAWLGIKVINDSAILHVVFNRTIVGVLRQAERDFKRLREALRDYGIKTMVASNPYVKDDRWPKLIRRFGFPEPRLVYVSTLEV